MMDTSIWAGLLQLLVLFGLRHVIAPCTNTPKLDRDVAVLLGLVARRRIGGFFVAYVSDEVSQSQCHLNKGSKQGHDSPWCWKSQRQRRYRSSSGTSWSHQLDWRKGCRVSTWTRRQPRAGTLSSEIKYWTCVVLGDCLCVMATCEERVLDVW